MAIPRRLLIDPQRPGWIHCISRCVRRAFLAGDGFAHRKEWVEERLRQLAGVFAVDVAAYAVMSNHVHVVVRFAPEAAAQWSASEVAERWAELFGTRLPKDASGRLVPAVLAGLIANPAWIAERRARLADVSWFMRALCESIARRANAEDECTGRFWEGRFTSVPLLDQASLLACMAYVDLNPIRAAIADRPESSVHTGAARRVLARQRYRVATRMVSRGATPDEAATRLRALGVQAFPQTPEDGLWLCPLARCLAGEPLANRRLSVDDYLTLVDLTGRVLRAGKRGVIPAALPPMLERLNLPIESWLETMGRRRALSGGTVGDAHARASEAVRRGLRWVRNQCPLFGKDARLATVAA